MGINMRVFIAIEVPFEKEFKEFQEKIKEFGGFNFPKQFHLTLKFLGEVNEVEKIKEKLREIKFKPFKVRLGNIGVFPHEKRINIIWVSLIPDDKIKKLQKSIEDILESFFGREKREFKAHVTLARVKFVRDKEKLLESLNTKINGEFKIDNFKLIKSELNSEGAKYTILEEYNGKEM